MKVIILLLIATFTYGGEGYGRDFLTVQTDLNEMLSLQFEKKETNVYFKELLKTQYQDLKDEINYRKRVGLSKKEIFEGLELQPFTQKSFK